MGPPIDIGHVDCFRHQKNQMISDDNSICNSAEQRKNHPSIKTLKLWIQAVMPACVMALKLYDIQLKYGQAQ